MLGGIIIFSMLAILAITGLEEMTVYFFTPQEILAEPDKFNGQTIRIGALVQSGSVSWDAQNIKLIFRVTEDSMTTIPVVYKGIKPDMFKEGQGVVVEGKMNDGIFLADRLLVKHSEEYSIDSADHKSKKEYYQSLLSQ